VVIGPWHGAHPSSDTSGAIGGSHSPASDFRLWKLAVARAVRTNSTRPHRAPNG
jgi:hypothetical protein